MVVRITSNSQSVGADVNEIFFGYYLTNNWNDFINSKKIQQELEDRSKRLSKEWVLYPDHAVFLGGQAAILHQSINIKDLENNDFNKPDFIFVLGEGVFERHKVSKSKKAQLRCYYEVLIRQPIEERLSVLPHKAIIELLNWDAEKYRQVQSL